MFRETTIGMKVLRGLAIVFLLSSYLLFVVNCAPPSEFVITKLIAGTVMGICAALLIIDDFLGDNYEE